MDYVIVGAGITGAVIARELCDAGYAVQVVEQRPHLGGNMHDAVHASGIRYHVYGPHYFRTASIDLWRYVNRFSRFYPYEAILKTQVGGKNFAWPLNRAELIEGFGEVDPQCVTANPTNFREAMLNQLSPAVYETFIEPYTEKQWGTTADKLALDLAGRIELRDSKDPRLKTSPYQGIPVGGYTAWFEKILDGIPVDRGVDFSNDSDRYQWRRKLIYTGPIDRLFNSCHGRLSYRAQQRTHLFFPDIDRAMPCGQVNFPSWEDGAHIRAIEWRHMLEPGEFNGKGTLVTTETPYSPQTWNDLEYPCPEAESRRRYALYRDLANERKDLLVCGRLGEYRYLDMDQALGRALMLSRQLIIEAGNVARDVA